MAIGLTGLLCGASLDQSIKQLPSRHRIGVRKFSEYVKAADLKNGVLWYAILGVGGSLFTILTGILVWQKMPDSHFSIFIYISAFAALGQIISTTQAAPAYFSLKKNDTEEDLRRILNKFERIQTIRTLFVVANFLTLLSAVYISL